MVQTTNKAVLIAKRGGICEICGGKIDWRRPADLNHAIVKKKRGHPEYDVEINYQVVHRVCHDRAHSFEERRKFWHKQIERGYHIEEWYRALNLRTRESFD